MDFMSGVLEDGCEYSIVEKKGRGERTECKNCTCIGFLSVVIVD